MNESKERRPILVVDDEESIRKLFHAILLRAGYDEIDLAQNGREALQMLEEKEYDVLCLDLIMPEVPGIEVLREVKKNRSRTEVLIISGYAGEPETINDCVELGAGGCLGLPLSTPHVLIQAVRALINKRNGEPYDEKALFVS